MAWAVLTVQAHAAMQSTHSQQQAVQHFVFFGRDRVKIADPAFLKTASLVGAQLTYAWDELEPAKDKYDFSTIQQDLKQLQAKGKQLFIQLQDTTFSTTRLAVPEYLRKDEAYKGGAVYQYDDNGKPEGWVAMRWQPAVQERFHKLLQALGKVFDGKIAGINLQETAIGVSAEGPNAAPGFTYEQYRDAIIANMKALKAAFPRSVAMQYINFMPGEWLPYEDHGYMDALFGGVEY